MVKTRRGFIGRTYNDEQWIDGKVPVHLLTEDRQIRMNPKTGQPLKLLCRPETLQIIGFID